MNNKPVTPNPTGGEIKPNLATVEENAYTRMDRRDEEIIVQSIMGAEVSSFVYAFEITPGNVVTDISIAGVAELQQFMGGIESQIMSIVRETENGRGIWRAVAVARDTFTGTSTDGHGECECEYYSKKKSSWLVKAHARQIAISKAKRNAIKLLLPQDIRKYLADLAKQGIETFSDEDIRKKFSPFWTSRNRLKERHFQMIHQIESGPQSVISAQQAIYSGVIDTQPTEQQAISSEASAPPPDVSQDPDARTKKQYGYLLGLLKSKCEMGEPEAKDFLKSNVLTKFEAMDMVKEIKASKDPISLIEKILWNQRGETNAETG